MKDLQDRNIPVTTKDADRPITRKGSTAPRGQALLENLALNKDTAFSVAEREEYGLTGLLPDTIETIDLQLDRVMLQLGQKAPLGQYVYLDGLADRNETLFFKTLMSDPARFLPIVYDPTVNLEQTSIGP